MKQILFIFAFFFLTAAAFADSTETVRLRMRWGGSASPAYGIISSDCGLLRDLTPISMDTENPGGAWIANGRVEICQEASKKYNGFDVSVPFRQEGNLYVQISADSDFSSNPRIQIPMRELLAGGKTLSFASDSGSSLQFSVSRVPGDSLRVQFGRDNLVFMPFDMFQCTVQPCLLPGMHLSANASSAAPTAGNGANEAFSMESAVPFQNSENASGNPLLSVQSQSFVQEVGPDERGDLEFVVYRGRETFEMHRGLIPGVRLDGVIPAQIQFSVPEEEGVYDVVLTLRKSEDSARRNAAALAERRIQFIVLSDAADFPNAEGKHTLELEIDPSQKEWWENLSRSDVRQFRTWFPEMEPLQNSARKVRSVGIQNFLELPQSLNPLKSPAWEAFPLLVENPGMPHILEVEYLSNLEQTFSLSIMEPNARGGIAPPGIDSGVNVPSPIGGSENLPARLDRHHILFWPQSRTPILLLVNRHGKNSVCIGKIRLYSAGSHLAPNGPASVTACENPAALQGTSAAAKFPNSAAGGTSKNFQRRNASIPFRQTALLIDKPMFTHAFSSSEMNNDATGLCVSDWVTFYDGGNRLTEYLEYVGFNTLFLSIYSDGSTIYPSRILNPTPRFDNGTYFPTAQDPLRKDVLEMLFRMFDRQDLKLIPAMDFSSPISSLETAARFPTAQETSRLNFQPGTLRWQNPFGKELTTVRSNLKKGAPYYNILHPNVQETVLQSIAEVVRRYGHHPAFGGISLQLHSNSFLVLPNSRWGVDAQTITQFSTETGIVLQGTYLEQVRSLVSGKYTNAWIRWRAGKMTAFYRRAASLLSSIPKAKLYLCGTDLFSLKSHPVLMPRLNGILPAEDVFLNLGIDVQQLKAIPNLVLSRPQKILVNKPVTEQAADLQWKQTPGTYRMFQDQKEPTAVFYHAPDILRLEAFDAASPFKPTLTWIASTYAQSTSEARRPYAEALAMLDAFTMVEGGWNPVFGKEQALQDTIRILGQLPAVHFNSAMSSSIQNGPLAQSIIFRSCSIPGQNYAYAVNTTPFKVTGRVYFQPSMNQAGEINAFSGSAILLKNDSSITLGKDARGFFWRVELAPYQIEAIRFDGNPVLLLDPETEVDPEAQLVFQREYLRLNRCFEGLKNPTFYLGLKNPGFESGTDENGSVHSWTVSYPSQRNSLTQNQPGVTPNPAASGFAPTAGSLASASMQPVSRVGNAVPGTPNVSANPIGNPDAAPAGIGSGTQNGFSNTDFAPGSTAFGFSNSVPTPILENSANARIDKNSIFGENSLCISSSGTPIRVMSQPFSVNPTGRLAIHIWTKAAPNEGSLPLRLIVVGKTPRGKFFRTANLSSDAAGITPEWKRLSIHVNDLPLEKDTELSLGFELYGPGSVWVDNIQLSDIHFSDMELQQLMGIFSQFGQRIQKQDYVPCVSTLECYWLRFMLENVAINMPPTSEPIALREKQDTSTLPNVEEVPTKKGPSLPHLGQMPALPHLPSPPKFPKRQTEEPVTEDVKEEEKKSESYLDKMKNLFPW